VGEISDANHVGAQEPEDRGASAATAAANHRYTVTCIEVGAAADAMSIMAGVVLKK
jgi:hypothetical protein